MRGKMFRLFFKSSSRLLSRLSGMIDPKNLNRRSVLAAGGSLALAGMAPCACE